MGNRSYFRLIKLLQKYKSSRIPLFKPPLGDLGAVLYSSLSPAIYPDYYREGVHQYK